MKVARAAFAFAVLFVFLALFLRGAPVRARASATSVQPTTPVVFLMFDEFPAIDLQQADGGIDAGRFPNFAELAARSIWFRNTTTLSATTTVAVPAILSGKKPVPGALPTYRDHPDNLFTLLGKRYRMFAIETEARLCPDSLCGRMNHPAESAHAGLRPFLGRKRDFERFVAAFRKPGSGRPTLYFLHVLLPHASWLYLPDGKLRAVAKTNVPGRYGERWFNSQLAIQAWQRHLLQVGYTDGLLGLFLKRLHQTGLWDEALIVVTADHGISFRGGDLRRRPTKTNLAELAFTPLFVKLPGDENGRVLDEHVQTVDILPTIADVLGIPIPWKTAGRSAFAEYRPPTGVAVAHVSAPYASALAQRQASLARQLSFFGSGAWDDDRFAGTGIYHGLVGADLATLPTVRLPGAMATVDRVGSRLLRRLPSGSAFVPSPLAGTLSGVHVGAAVALALNGRIAAVSVAYRKPGGGPLRFSELAPESAFRVGRNSVRSFVVTGPRAQPRLEELSTRLTD
jgi:Sulfatase